MSDAIMILRRNASSLDAAETLNSSFTSARLTIPTVATGSTMNASAWAATVAPDDTHAAHYGVALASAPATGQFSVAAGVYTFAAADTGHTVFIRYRYAAAAAEFEAGDRIHPSPDFAFNIGRCYDRLERWREAAKLERIDLADLVRKYTGEAADRILGDRPAVKRKP